MHARSLIASFLSFAAINTAGAAQEARPAPNGTRASPATQPTTRPSTQPATNPDARNLSSDQMLGQMLRPPTGGQPRPLQPLPDVPLNDRTSGPGAVKPGAPAVATLREGTYIIDRQGRLEKTPDGSQAQFVFDGDGKSMREPPLVIVPNLKLMMMENAIDGATRDLRFRVSGMVTEYRGRNYILLEKVFVVPEQTQF